MSETEYECYEKVKSWMKDDGLKISRQKVNEMLDKMRKAKIKYPKFDLCKAYCYAYICTVLNLECGVE